ncbi:MAG: hypothetical protein IKX55_07910 [Bacteroidaceae bacterium]|nr:hypothetical protein [Bacteroidaceae bacterium]
MTSCLRLTSILLLAFFSISFTRLDDGMVRGRRAVNALMDSVEFMMDDYPAQADSLIKMIDPKSIRAKRQKARYALLYTAAEYKNYQPFTSDSLIMEAVRYYSKRRNIDYRFLSYYNLGCVYMEMNQFKDASVAFAQAEWLVDRIDNDFWKGLLYARLGDICGESCDFIKKEDYYLRAENCFEQAEKELHRLYALFNVGRSLIDRLKFNEADSIFQIVEQGAASIENIELLEDCLNYRLLCFIYLKDLDSARYLLEKHNLIIDKPTHSLGYLGMMAYYYDLIEDFSKSESYLNAASKCINTVTDSIYWFYYNLEISKKKNQKEDAFEYLGKLYDLQIQDIRSILNESIFGAQYDHYRAVAELESVKARNKITILVASVIIIILIVLSISIYSRNKRREYESQIRDYISTINELTTQISIHQDKIGNLNAKVREMLRQQFNSSDYLYTRYYEQIDDNKKAEHLYRVVKTQLEGFTNHKNICHIDELLDEAFDGIMEKILSSGLDIKEKDLLLLRFALAGFSAKSIAALLNDTNQNINQRKKRMLDKIQTYAPNLMNELRNALENK